ncbi:unnamed protein product [Calicophoron daubneyi]|uniref:Uncharacterized protein n=1 Tax=Calicophoron daubneyi TaxID=300641 RepID=A0AAV2T6V5_CALDB
MNFRFSCLSNLLSNWTLVSLTLVIRLSLDHRLVNAKLPPTPAPCPQAALEEAAECRTNFTTYLLRILPEDPRSFLFGVFFGDLLQICRDAQREENLNVCERAFGSPVASTIPVENEGQVVAIITVSQRQLTISRNVTVEQLVQCDAFQIQLNCQPASNSSDQSNPSVVRHVIELCEDVQLYEKYMASVNCVGGNYAHFDQCYRFVEKSAPQPWYSSCVTVRRLNSCVQNQVKLRCANLFAPEMIRLLVDAGLDKHAVFCDHPSNEKQVAVISSDYKDNSRDQMRQEGETKSACQIPPVNIWLLCSVSFLTLTLNI